MVSANGIKCAICYDSICCDSTKYESIELTCGHAFGKSCMRKWVESSTQKKCLFCQNQLTDNEIKEIKNIPLQERVVIISEKTIKLFGRTMLMVAPPVAALEVAVLPVVAAIGAAIGAGATEVVTGWGLAVAGSASGVAAGVAAGAAGAAVGIGRATGVAAGASAGVVGVAAGAVGVAAGVVWITAGAVGAVGVVGVVGVVGAVVAAGGTVGAVGADIAYLVQEMNPVVV